MKYLDMIYDHGIDPYVSIVAPYLYDGDHSQTSVIRAWRKSFWSISGTPALAWNSTYHELLEGLVKWSNRTKFAMNVVRQSIPQGGLGEVQWRVWQ